MAAMDAPSARRDATSAETLCVVFRAVGEIVTESSGATACRTALAAAAASVGSAGLCCIAVIAVIAVAIVNSSFFVLLIYKGIIGIGVEYLKTCRNVVNRLALC